jgi:hypothetical protein
MPIPDPPPEPTHYRVLLSDPEGFDTVELQRLGRLWLESLADRGAVATRDGATDEEAQRQSCRAGARISQSGMRVDLNDCN